MSDQELFFVEYIDETKHEREAEFPTRAEAIKFADSMENFCSSIHVFDEEGYEVIR